MQTKLIIGGPGSGKTARLLAIMEEELTRGIRPDRIAFVSFTKKAADEARDRAMDKFRFESSDLPNVRTLHSLCHLKTGVRSGQIMTFKDYKAIAERLGVELSMGYMNPDDSITVKDGDKMIHMDNMYRTTKQSLKQTWEHLNSPFPFGQLEQWVATSNEYKKKFDKLDFTDLLTKFMDEGFPIPVDVAFVDEAQDLTLLEWDVIHKAFANVDRLYIAGDDDQAIYGWSGANVDRFLSLKFDDKEILPVSYRLPHNVFHFASEFACKFITNRYDKDWNAYDDNEPGFVKRISTLEELDLTDGTWYLLSRNSCFLKPFSDKAKQVGVSYSFRRKPSVDPVHATAIRLYEEWREGSLLSVANIKKVFEQMKLGRVKIPDGRHPISRFSSDPPVWWKAFTGMPKELRFYYKSIIENEGSLLAEPRVQVNTIHAVKGGEADYVVIRTDLTRRTFDGMMRTGGMDSEGRVFYVGATRAKKGVYLITPQTQFSFDGYWSIKSGEKIA